MYVIEILKANNSVDKTLKVVKVETFEHEREMFRKMQELTDENQYFKVSKATKLFENKPNA